jgi:hypothetical protein
MEEKVKGLESRIDELKRAAAVDTERHKHDDVLWNAVRWIGVAFAIAW